MPQWPGRARPIRRVRSKSLPRSTPIRRLQRPWAIGGPSITGYSLIIEDHRGSPELGFQMDLKDLREYTQALDDIGEVQSIDKSVDLFLEAGGIIRPAVDVHRTLGRQTAGSGGGGCLAPHRCDCCRRCGMASGDLCRAGGLVAAIPVSPFLHGKMVVRSFQRKLKKR